MRKSFIFLYFCLSFVIGIALRSIFSFDIFYAFAFLLICLVLSVFFWPIKKYRLMFLGAIFLFLGILRFAVSMPKINENQIAFYNNSKAEFAGQVVAEPDMREKYVKLTLGHLEIQKGNGRLHRIQGKALVNVYKYYENYNYGDWLKVKCRLEKPGIIAAKGDFSRNFDYGKYLAVSGIFSVCYRPENIERLASVKPKIIRRYTEVFLGAVFKAKQKFKKIIDKNLPLPHSGLLEAMLLGYRRELPKEIIKQFSQTGVSHIVAISGLHISILAGILFYLFVLLGVPRQKSFWPTVAILFLYVILIGFRASAVRSFIMAMFLLYALKIGRLSKSVNALIFAGVILLALNPKLLMADVGFQLSFLAVLGILYFYPLFIKALKPRQRISPSRKNILRFLNSRFFNSVLSIVFVTFSAQILTLPLVVYYFGVLSVISPLANLLILPILPVVMIGGIILIVLGLIWSKLAFMFGILVWIILSYILKIIEFLSQMPFGHFEFKTVRFGFIVLGYLIIIYGFYVYQNWPSVSAKS